MAVSSYLAKRWQKMWNTILLWLSYGGTMPLYVARRKDRTVFSSASSLVLVDETTTIGIIVASPEQVASWMRNDFERMSIKEALSRLGERYPIHQLGGLLAELRARGVRLGRKPVYVPRTLWPLAIRIGPFFVLIAPKKIMSQEGEEIDG